MTDETNDKETSGKEKVCPSPSDPVRKDRKDVPVRKSLHGFT